MTEVNNIVSWKVKSGKHILAIALKPTDHPKQVGMEKQLQHSI